MKTFDVLKPITLLALLSASPAFTQELGSCEDKETVPQCSDRLAGRNLAEDEALRKAIDDKSRQNAEFRAALPGLLAGLNTGDSTSQTITDFLPLLRLLLDAGGSTTDTPDKLGAEWNNPLKINRRHQHKVSLALAKSEMFEPLKKSLQEAGFSDQADNLAGGIDQGDDVRIKFSYSPATENMGRDPDIDEHAKLLSTILHVASQEDVAGAAQEAQLNAQIALQDFIEKHGLRPKIKQKSKTNPEVMEDLPISEIPDDLEGDYIRLVTNTLTAAMTSVRSLNAGLHAGNFYGVIDLINNQPQFVASAEYVARDELVGPDEVKAVLSYEAGGPSMKAFRKHQKRACPGQTDTQCLAGYLDSPDVKQELSDGSMRFKISAEYSKLQRLEFALPNTTFTYLAEPVEHLTVSASLGRYFGKELAGGKRARFDATASYEDFSDDPLRQDRGVAQLAVIYPVAEGFFLSLGAVYATKPEYRGDVDAEISARAGFTYKVLESK